jgi:hypothetical protein
VGAVQSALGLGGCGREILHFGRVPIPLQFIKTGSTATLPQKEKSNTADLQRGRVRITGFI